MKFGLDADDFKTLNELVVHPLKGAGFKIYVFGSRVHGSHHEFSDIDLLLCAPENFDRALLNSVKENIEEARFPIKVDFVLNSELAQSYRANVEKEKVEI